MKYDETMEHGKIRSEGKILEIIPLLIDPVGQPMALPPVHWHVDNQIMGFEPYHVLSGPFQFVNRERINIPGSMASYSTQIEFLVRVLEGGQDTRTNSVDAEAVREFLNILRYSPKQIPR